MTDATLVQVLDTTDEFPVELGCLLLVEPRISDDKVKKLTPIGMLHDHEKLLLCLNDLNGSDRSIKIKTDTHIARNGKREPILAQLVFLLTS